MRGDAQKSTELRLKCDKKRYIFLASRSGSPGLSSLHAGAARGRGAGRGADLHPARIEEAERGRWTLAADAGGGRWRWTLAVDAGGGSWTRGRPWGEQAAGGSESPGRLPAIEPHESPRIAIPETRSPRREPFEIRENGDVAFFSPTIALPSYSLGGRQLSPRRSLAGKGCYTLSNIYEKELHNSTFPYSMRFAGWCSCFQHGHVSGFLSMIGGGKGRKFPPWCGRAIIRVGKGQAREMGGRSRARCGLSTSDKGGSLKRFLFAPGSLPAGVPGSRFAELGGAGGARRRGSRWIQEGDGVSCALGRIPLSKLERAAL